MKMGMVGSIKLKCHITWLKKVLMKITGTKL